MIRRGMKERYRGILKKSEKIFGNAPLKIKNFYSLDSKLE